MAQMLRIKSAGGLTKLSLAPKIKKSDGYQTRREKRRMTTAAQKYVNSKVQHDQLEFLLAANVRQGDWFLTLTYDDDHLPDSWNNANKKMQYFVANSGKAGRNGRPSTFTTLSVPTIQRMTGAPTGGTTTWCCLVMCRWRTSGPCGDRAL